MKSWLKRLWQRRWLRRTIASVLVLVLVSALLDIAFPPPQPPGWSVVVEAEDGRMLHAFLSPDDKWRMYTRLEEISPRLQQTLLNKEDRWFYWHPGVNPLAIARALFNNVVKGRRTSGASTLTMQVVRMLEPADRTYWAKLREMLRALQLELHYSKDEILQLYLNLAPYGSNVEGIKAASWVYFGRPPEALSLAQITVLTIVPNRPTSLRPDQAGELLQRERDRWLDQLALEGIATAEEVADAKAEPIRVQRHTLPKEAPHLALRLVNEAGGQPLIRSTLSYNVQARTQQMVANYVERIRHLGITNAAVMVVDNRTHAVKAYVGSADFYDGLASGQVDGIQALRSPGSTLKPLLYGLAMDSGLVSLRTMVTDVPINFSGYSPQNYNEKFNGQVSIQQSLALSLNIPAVKVLNDLGVPALTGTLATAGFRHISANRKKLGLSMILGGCGVRLDELTGLFSAFANAGIYSPLTFRSDSPSDTAYQRRLLSAESTYLLTQVLADIVRPDLPNNFENSLHLPRVAWKTGTSYGRRDAWAIGYNAQYTIGVWVGNFDGKGSPALAGADIATPLLFQLFNILEYNSTAAWFTQPKGLAPRSVCAQTGLVPDSFCTDLVPELFVPGVSPARKCDHLKPYFVSPDRRYTYCKDYLPAGAVLQRYPNYPPELIAWWRDNAIPFQGPPPFHPSCQQIGQSEGLYITSPSAGATYYLDMLGKKQMGLQAHSPSDVRKLHWFVNDRYLGESKPGVPFFFRPDTGQVKVSVTDDLGRTATVVFRAKPL